MCCETGEGVNERLRDSLEPGLRPDKGGSLVAGVVIETIPHRARRVENLLGRVDGLRIVGGDGDRRLAGVLTAANGEVLVEVAEELVRNHEDILGIFPTFIGRDDDDATIRKESTED